MANKRYKQKVIIVVDNGKVMCQNIGMEALNKLMNNLILGQDNDLVTIKFLL